MRASMLTQHFLNYLDSDINEVGIPERPMCASAANVSLLVCWKIHCCYNPGLAWRFM